MLAFRYSESIVTLLILGLLKKFAGQEGKAIILSTHDLDLGIRNADRFWLMTKNNTIVSGFLRLWTRRVLERIGLDIAEQNDSGRKKEIMKVTVTTPDKGEFRWDLVSAGHSCTFHTVYDLVSYIKDILREETSL